MIKTLNGCFRNILYWRIAVGILALTSLLRLITEPTVLVPITVGISTWPGFAPGLVANGGLISGPKSRFVEKHLNVRFEVVEDTKDWLAQLTSQRVNLIWATVDSMAYYAIHEDLKVQAILAVDSSADSYTVLRSLKSTSDPTPAAVTAAWLPQAQVLFPPNTAFEIKLGRWPEFWGHLRDDPPSSVVLWEPYTTLANRSAFVKDRSRGGREYTHVLIGLEDYCKRNPELIDEFVTIWLDTADEILSRNGSYESLLKIAEVLQRMPPYDEFNDPNEIVRILEKVHLAGRKVNRVIFGVGKEEGQFVTLFNDAQDEVVRRFNEAPKRLPPSRMFLNSFVVNAGVGTQVARDETDESLTCQDDNGVLVVTEDKSVRSIRFRSGSSELEPSSQLGWSNSDLEELFKRAISYQREDGALLCIVGHADRTGEALGNQRLSEQRAATVLKAFRQFVADRNCRCRVAVIGRGDTRPATEDPKRHDENRRVELRIVNYQRPSEKP